MSHSIRHIPHSSTEIPTSFRKPFLLPEEELERELLHMTDWYTDELFSGDSQGALVFPVSRLLVDVERFEKDEEEVMASRGMGVFYTNTHHLKPLRRELTQGEREDLLGRYYRPHHQKLEAMVDHLLEETGHALVIDCHSFPPQRLPYEIATEEDPRPEICIGTDSFHTPPMLRDTALETFAGAGYIVGLDSPFSGALTPMKHYGEDKRVHALMIEIRRDLYMDEDTAGKSAGFEHVRKTIQSSIQMLENLGSNLHC